MQVDLFGNLIIEEEAVVTKVAKPSPFSFTNNVANKQYPQSLEGYSPWLFNVSYSQRTETVFHANEMNKYHLLPEKAQFDFYYYSLPKKNFFAKWAKADKVEHIDAVCAYFGCSEKEAHQYIKVLTNDQLNTVIEWANNSKGGKNDSRSSSVLGNGNVPRSKR
jgi:hypothetical protein